MLLKFKKLLSCIILFSYFQSHYGQDNSISTTDFIKNSSYESIYNSYLEVFEDTIKSKIYLKAYIKKAQSENNIEKKADGLTYLSYYEKDEINKLALLDSAIILLNSDTLKYKPPILQHSFKGGYFRDKGSYKEALNNYIKALAYAEKSNNEQYIYITKHNIGVLKLSVGNYDEAIALFKECINYDEKIQETETHGHSKTLLSLSEAYVNKKYSDSASVYIEKGLLKTKDNYKDLYNEFLIFKGINLFIKGNYDAAKLNIERAIFHLNDSNPQTRRSLLFGYFYLAKSYVKSNQLKKAVFYFLKLDSLIANNKVLFAEFRDSYQYLIDYYKKNDNKEMD